MDTRMCKAPALVRAFPWISLLIYLFLLEENAWLQTSKFPGNPREKIRAFREKFGSLEPSCFAMAPNFQTPSKRGKCIDFEASIPQHLRALTLLAIHRRELFRIILLRIPRPFVSSDASSASLTQHKQIQRIFRLRACYAPYREETKGRRGCSGNSCCHCLQLNCCRRCRRIHCGGSSRRRQRHYQSQRPPQEGRPIPARKCPPRFHRLVLDESLEWRQR